MSKASYDVIVAGLGAMGGATAYHLARRGLRVLGLDRYEPPHTLGSSHGETRVIRAAYFEHPAYVPLVQRAYTLWGELEEEAGRELLRITGGVMLGAEESEAVRGSLRSAEEHGLQHERLSAREIRARFPAFRPDRETVGVYEPRAGALRVEEGVAAHLQAAAAHGAELRYGEPVAGWRASGEAVEVRTASGRYRAAALVLAVGAWLPELVPSVPLRVERQVQFWFRPRADPQAFLPGRFPVFLWEAGAGKLFYGLPDFGGGVKVARHHGGGFTTPDTVDREVTDQDIAEVRSFLSRSIPAADGEPLRSSVCLYTNTPDQHFLVDCHPEHPDVWLVSPCSGHGFKFAPVIGERVAEGVTSNEVPAELAFCGVSRLLR